MFPIVSLVPEWIIVLNKCDPGYENPAKVCVSDLLFSA